jgi:transcriptional regulator with XRE-family HTH domain
METNFADRLKSERERLGLSQDDLAKLVDKKKKQSFISNFETGARKGTAWIVEIAHALGVDAYWLKTGKGIRVAAGVQLSNDQATLLKGFALFDKSLQDNWLENAQRAIDKDAATKKVRSFSDAATNKAA